MGERMSNMNNLQIHWGNRSHEQVVFQQNVTQDSVLPISR